MLLAVHKHPSPIRLTFRTCLDCIKSPQDLARLSASSRLVNLIVDNFGCRTLGGQIRRDAMLADLLASLPNLQHLEIDYADGLSVEHPWYTAKEEQGFIILEPLESLTLRSYDIESCGVEELLSRSMRAGVRTLRLLRCRDFVSPSDLWGVLSHHTTTLEIMEPLSQGLSRDHRENELAIRRILGQLPLLERLVLHKIGVPLRHILPGVCESSFFLAELHHHDPQIHNPGLHGRGLISYGLDRMYQLHPIDYARTTGVSNVRALILLRSACPNLVRLSFDLSTEGLTSDRYFMCEEAITVGPSDKMLMQGVRFAFIFTISKTIRSFYHLQHLMIVVNLPKEMWSRKTAIRVASDCWNYELRTFEMAGPAQLALCSGQAVYEPELDPLSERQPWWIVRQKAGSRRNNFAPQDLTALNRIDPEVPRELGSIHFGITN